MYVKVQLADVFALGKNSTGHIRGAMKI